jgi:cytochrome c peroxidase
VEEIKTIPLDSPTTMTAERQGEIYFNDASLCFQQWQSCASCHSDDGRVDALNWDLLNDGIGNPKNVKSLLLSHVTPPVMSLGVRADAETAVRAGIRHIQFAVRPEEDAQAIDAYVKSLTPVPAPKLVNGDFSTAAKRGAKIYVTAGCAHCHPAPLYTNLESYDFGTGKDQDEGKKFDTPTLIEVWRTSPYWHDGRAATIEEAIELHYVNDKYKPELTDEEMKDLVEYVESL